MSDAASLYWKPLSQQEIWLDDVRILLKKGLASTCEDVKNFDTKTLQRAARALGATTPVNRKLALMLIQAWVQVEWYRAKGSEPSEKVQHRLTQAREEVCPSTPS